MLSAARRLSAGEISLESMAPVPAEGIGVMSLLARMAGRHRRRVRGLYHDFVIKASERNKLKDRPNWNLGAYVREREDEWTGLMRSAISGDNAAYHRLLKAITPVLRAAARRGLARAGQPVDQSEDIVQDILLAVHLKRHTWDANAPFAPWLFAIRRWHQPCHPHGFP
jgi:hypothetical protein